MVSPVVLAHISSLYDRASQSGGGERWVAHKELNRDSISLSVLLRTDRVGFPSALWQSWCLGSLDVRPPTLLPTQLRPNSEPTAVRLQHMSNLYIWFYRKKNNKKTFLECLCMNLNFKLFLILFLFFFFFLFNYCKHRAILREKLCKYLIYFISWIQKMYVR